MKKIILLITAFLLFAFPIFAQFDNIQKDEVNLENIYGQEESYTFEITGEHIRSFKSDIEITKEGRINVRETIVYDFTNLQKHGIYRDIPYITTNKEGKKYELTFNKFKVTDENGKAYNFTTSNISGQNIRLKIGDANRFVTGVNTYIISYEVSGALTYFSDHDELYWNVTGNDWTVPIAMSTASVVIPGDLDSTNIKIACFTGYKGDNLTLCQKKYNKGLAAFIADESFNSGQGLTIVVGFPKNIVAELLPKEFIAFQDTWLGKLLQFLLVLLVATWYLFLPLYIVFRWIKYGRDPKGTMGEARSWFDPPKTFDNKRFLTPGEVGTLGDETVDMKDISATIVDLARRGYLIIDERKKGDFYLIKNKGGGGDLLPFENTILTRFFGSKKEIRIKDEKLVSEVEEVKNELYKQVVTDKLFDKNPATTRTGYYVLSGFALFTGNFFLAIIAFIFGRAMPRKTIIGVDAKNTSSSLKNFLTSQQRQLEFQADRQMMFEKLLPFAVAFGVERIWAKRFESLHIAPPSWYRSYSTTRFNSMMLVNSLNSSFRTVATSATPTRSSTGHSSGFSGGFSGGGGGGGGGGSW